MIIPKLIAHNQDSLREAFGKALCILAKKYKNFYVFDGDLAGGTGVHHFRKKFKSRFIQCGIAEQNMICAAAGFSASGKIVFATTFSIFSLRAIEQTILSIAYTKRNVKIVASHPGLDVGPDGASAQCLEDLACFRSIPNMVVLSPADPIEMLKATEAIIKYKGPVYMRTGRSPTQKIFNKKYQFKIGKGNVLKLGKDLTIICCGVQVRRSLKAAKILEKKGIKATVINMASIKPIDEKLIVKFAKKTKCIITSEDHNIYGGLGSAVSEVVTKNYPVIVERNGVKDIFGESGNPEELAKKYEINEQNIVKCALRALKKKNNI